MAYSIPVVYCFLNSLLLLLYFLVKYVDKVDQQDANGQTACHLAALNGEVDCVKVLLEQGMKKFDSINFVSFFTILKSVSIIKTMIS